MRGQEVISERIIQLLEGATSRIVFGVQDERLLTADIVQALREQASADVDVLLISFNRTTGTKRPMPQVLAFTLLRRARRDTYQPRP